VKQWFRPVVIPLNKDTGCLLLSRAALHLNITGATQRIYNFTLL